MIYTLQKTSKWLVLLAALFAGRLTHGQVQPCKIYQTKNADGSVAIVGENHGAVPFSVLLEAKLVLMHSSVVLPARIPLPPAEGPQILAVFTPDAPNPYYRYYTTIDLGVYTGHAPDSTIRYALPYVTASDTIRARAKAPHQYAFALPAGTPIVAARAGMVGYVKDDKQHARNSKSGNTVFVYHPDGTYASYSNLTQNSTVVQVGQVVKPGDLLGYFGGNKYESNFWFTVVYLTRAAVAAAPVIFEKGK